MTVTQEQIKQNHSKLETLREMVIDMITQHEKAMYSYKIGEEIKHIPDEDIQVLVDEYKVMKAECVSKFAELL